MLAGLNRTLDEWLCDSFAELIEEIELWKWDDATGDFWSRLAKTLQQSNISGTWAEQLDSRLKCNFDSSRKKWTFSSGSLLYQGLRRRREKYGVEKTRD